MQRIADPQGRLDDIFVYDDGLSVHPHLFRSALGHYREILEYQVRQTRRGATIGLVTVGPVDVQTLRTRITAGLAALGLTDPRVDIETVPELPREASGKLKRFVTLAAPTDIP